MQHSKIQPIGDRILIRRRDEDKEQSRDGVIIPDSAKEISLEAEVIALGSGRGKKGGGVAPFEVHIGDTVLVARHSGEAVRLGNRNHTIVREDDILCILGGAA
ncbi:co-chaperone GroES [Termitidicoccus mucosus]|uniref:Co-chaperonin GroES n=1 Tax=Termitidicoccus mucosus TaxID=1184151 RepID=A0A178IE60_9BACT|nr:molecular chaperone GroES [Opitutaceae bacterium TSB47]